MPLQEPALAVVFSPREWANRVVRHVTDHGGGRVRLRVVDGRVALEEEFDILIAEDVTSFLNARFVHEVHKRGRQILGVYDPEEATGRERLLELAVDDVIEATATSEEFVRRIRGIIPDVAFLPGPGPGATPGATPGTRPPGAPPPMDPALAALGLASQGDGGEGTEGWRPGRRPRGLLWAIGGPPGGCGASEVAVELARALRLTRGSSVLLDLDERAPCLAQRLGLPPIPNVRSALDALFHGAGHLGAAFQPVLAGGFELLAGLANPSDWSQLRAHEVTEVASELRAVRDHIVVNVSPYLEDLARAGSPDRFGVTRAILAAADVVVGVGLATPVGVARMVAWLADVSQLAPGRPVHLVVNRAPTSSFVRSEVRAEILRNFAPASLQFAPVDASVEKAAWRGELVPTGPFTRAVGDLAALAPTPAPAPGGTGRGGHAHNANGRVSRRAGRRSR